VNPILIRRLAISGLLVCTPCVRPQSAAAQEPVAALQQALDADVAASASLPGELLHVHSPARGVDVSLAAGVADRATGRALGPHDGFRAASVTKTFTAAAILRLVEQGRLRLDDPITRHLPPEYEAALREGGYAVDSITVRQLLTHTSGIHDYATDERYYAAVLGDPMHRWTRLEQVRAAVEWGRPHFAPGAGYHYSDTGYVLLGEMIERRSWLGLGEAIRGLLGFERLGLDETYLETLEPAPAGAGEMSHPYFGEQDTRGWDPSFDLYGGGGIVTSAEDLARFYRALLRGEVFSDSATLRVMLTVPATNERAPGGPYAMGIQRIVLGGQACWGHTGFWGTAAHHCPDADVTVVRHTNQAQPDDAFIYRTLYDRIVGVLGMAP
jgi:D-alanyl-D-alanine carboxypeptidase